MKLIIALASLITILSISASRDFSILCDHEFKKTIMNVLESPTGYCEAEVIYGTDRVCFEGNVESLVAFLNDGKFGNASSGHKVADAKIIDKDLISYLGIDQRNFYSVEVTLNRCD